MVGSSEGAGSAPQAEPVLRLRTDALDWLAVGPEIVALDGRQDLYLGTNLSGAELWRALSAGTTRTELVQLLVDSFEIDTGRASADVDSFLQALAEQSLLEGS